MELKRHKSCGNCMAYSNSRTIVNKRVYCDLGYENEWHPDGTGPLEPCPKPCQYRTLRKAPRKVMASDKEMMAEHKAIYPDYEGSPISGLPTFPEKEGPMKSWEHWERQQAEELKWFKLSEI